MAIKWEPIYGGARRGKEPPIAFEAQLGVLHLSAYDNAVGAWNWSITVRAPGGEIIVKSGKHAGPYGAKAAARGAAGRIASAIARAL